MAQQGDDVVKLRCNCNSKQLKSAKIAKAPPDDKGAAGCNIVCVSVNDGVYNACHTEPCSNVRNVNKGFA